MKLKDSSAKTSRTVNSVEADVMFLLANTYELTQLSFLRGRDAEAEGDVHRDALQRLNDGGEACLVNFLVNELLGVVYHLRGNFDAAEAHLWMALSGTLLQYGPQHPWTTRFWMTYLEARKR